MKTLKLLLQEKDGGFYAAVSLSIEIPQSGDIGPLLQGAYMKLEKDLEKLDWKGEKEKS